MRARGKKTSLKRLYQSIYEKGSATKPGLAEEYGTSLTAVSDYVNQLEELGWVHALRKGESKGGRRPVVYQANPKQRFVAGVDIRDTHFYVFLADLDSEIMASQVVPIVSTRYADYVDELHSALSRLQAAQALDAALCLGVGVCIAGVTDFDNRIVDRSRELDWTNQPLGYDLERRLGIPVFVETDSRAYARNEIDPADPRNVAVVLYVSNSVGLTIVINNSIFQGYTNRAGDHSFLGDELKRLRSSIRENPYLQRIAQQPYYSKSVSPETLKELNGSLEEHLRLSPENAAVVDEFTSQLARLAATAIQIINPKRVLLTGNVFDYTDTIYHAVRTKICNTPGIRFIPETRRSRTLSDPLERALVRLVMEKFFAYESFASLHSISAPR